MKRLKMMANQNAETEITIMKETLFVDVESSI
jgi:hypothetical protein